MKTGHRKTSRWLLAAAVQLALVGGLCEPAGAASKETELQAAFLYNFAKLVEWPSAAFESGSAPLRLCVLGDGDLVAALEEATAGRTVGERPLQAVDATAEGASAALATCHIVYVSADLPGGAAQQVRGLRTRPILTVSDDEEFARHGGVANFRRDGSYLRIDLNADAARDRGLKIGAQLMQVANLVSTSD